MLRRGRRPFELFAQTADVDVDRADIAAVIVAPDRIKQRLARIDAVRVAHEQLDQVEFLLRQIDEAAIVIGVARTAVDGDVIARKHVGLLLAGGTRAAKQRTDARFEFQNVEGLGQIVVRPVLKAHELVHVLRFCG